MSDHFAPLANDAILDISFDRFSHPWPVVLSADQLGSFCRSPVSCQEVVVVSAYKTRPEFLVVWYPNFALIPQVLILPFA